MKNFKMMLLALFASVLFVPSVLADCELGSSAGAKASVKNTNDNLKYCDTVSNAINAANDGAVVTLLEDVTIASTNGSDRIVISNKKLTFDFGGKHITTTQLESQYAAFKVDGSSSEVTFKGEGGIENKNGSSALLVTGNAKVTINGGEFIQSGETNDNKNYSAVSVDTATLKVEEGADQTVTITGGIGVFGTSPSLTVVSGTITAEDFAISGNGSTTFTSTINIQGGTIKSNGSAAIYNPQSGTLNITGGDIEGKIGIVARGGTVTISDNANITATGKADETYEVGDATDRSGKVKLPGGVGLIVDNTESYPHAEAEVKGGNFTTEGDAVLAYKNEQNSDDKIKVSGGKFNQGIPAQYLDESADVEQSESGVVGKVYDITVEKTENGEVKVNKNAAVGETVKIETIAGKGYKLGKITVTYSKDGKDEEVEVKDGSFVMPEGAVKVSVTFVKVDDTEASENPATYDGIFTYVTLAVASLGVLAVASKKVLKNN